MKRIGFFFESSKCIGCFACEVACKQENNIRPHVDEEPGSTGPRWRRVYEYESGSYPQVRVRYISLSCLHCAKPPCMAVCPSGAISKDNETGIVMVDKNKCIGCDECISACPFGAPQFDDEGLMEKCDFCASRIAQNQIPACVAACPSKALTYGTLDVLSEKRGRKAGEKILSAVEPSFFISA